MGSGGYEPIRLSQINVRMPFMQTDAHLAFGGCPSDNQMPRGHPAVTK